MKTAVKLILIYISFGLSLLLDSYVCSTLSIEPFRIVTILLIGGTTMCSIHLTFRLMHELRRGE